MRIYTTARLAGGESTTDPVSLAIGANRLDSEPQGLKHPNLAFSFLYGLATCAANLIQNGRSN